MFPFFACADIESLLTYISKVYQMYTMVLTDRIITYLFILALLYPGTPFFPGYRNS